MAKTWFLGPSSKKKLGFDFAQPAGFFSESVGCKEVLWQKPGFWASQKQIVKICCNVLNAVLH